MAEHELKARSIGLDDSWEVIVAGGGPAGCAAAAAAAREGAKTLLLEATGALGGMGTSGLVPAWCPFTDKEKIIYRGIAERVLNETKKGMPHVNPDDADWVPIDPERLKRVYDDLVTEAGAAVLFNTLLAGVEAEKGRVTTAIVCNKAGLSALRARVFVDATGDGDLAAWAGAEFEKGTPKGGELQPATHCFILSNVDEHAYRYGRPTWGGDPRSPIHDILKSGRYPSIPDWHICNAPIGPGAVGFNAGHVWDADNNDPASVSRALMKGRKLAAAFRDALAEFSPAAFGNAFLAATGSLLGIRETRRIIGDYILTAEDYRTRRAFPDEICRNAYYLDVHGTKDDEKRRRFDPARIEEARKSHYQPGESHGIPYRCLTPKGLVNVLVAGRCISSDRQMNGSVRVMPVCLATGEAAGVAAAFAAKAPGNDVHAVDVARLRKRLREVGQYLPE